MVTEYPDHLSANPPTAAGTQAPKAAGRRGSEASAGTSPAKTRLGDLGPRILVAVPIAAATVLLVLQGGIVLALALAPVAAGAALEASRLLDRLAPVREIAVVAAAALPPVALFGGATAVMLVLVAALPAAFALARLRPVLNAPDGARIAATIAVVAWIGLPLGHGMLLRELPGGAELAIGVLVGTFVGDTAAHLVGAALGRTHIAPRLSPRKTLEGLLAGIVVGTASLWLFLTLADARLQGIEAAALGLVVALAAPIGDLFESAFKRDAGVKDTGRLLGPHGGLLDRIDAVLFSLVAGYYLARVLL